MAIYPDNAYGQFSTTNFTSMVDRKPDKGYNETRAYSTITFTSEAGYEKRRIRTRRPKRDYNFTYSKVDGLVKESVQSFYNSRSGDYESFTLDLAHINEAGNVTVRFDGALNINQVLSTGANVLNNYYTVSFKLKETFD
jgi:hypothetical protein